MAFENGNVSSCKNDGKHNKFYVYSLKKYIDRMLVTAATYNGYVYGGYVRDVCFQQMKNPSNTDISWTDVDIWFEHQSDAKLFVDAMGESFQLPKINPNIDLYDYTCKRYTYIVMDTKIVDVDIMIGTFIVDDFNVNTIRLKYNSLYNIELHKDDNKDQTISDIFHRKAYITTQYVDKCLVGDGDHKYYHLKRVCTQFLNKGWNIRLPDKTLVESEDSGYWNTVDGMGKLRWIFEQAQHDIAKEHKTHILKGIEDEYKLSHSSTSTTRNNILPYTIPIYIDPAEPSSKQYINEKQKISGDVDKEEQKVSYTSEYHSYPVLKDQSCENECLNETKKISDVDNEQQKVSYISEYHSYPVLKDQSCENECLSENKVVECHVMGHNDPPYDVDMVFSDRSSEATSHALGEQLSTITTHLGSTLDNIDDYSKLMPMINQLTATVNNLSTVLDKVRQQIMQYRMNQ